MNLLTPRESLTATLKYLPGLRDESVLQILPSDRLLLALFPE